MKLRAAATLVFAACATSSHVELPLWLDLKPGSHAVGYRNNLWYPAQPAGEHLRYRDYFDSLDDVEASLHARGISAEAMVELFDSPMYARRDAPALGRFPRVVINLGNAQSHADQVVLGEYLASHGYEVALGSAVGEPIAVIGPEFGGAGLKAIAGKALKFLRGRP